jgi:hypothetical protein
VSVLVSWSGKIAKKTGSRLRAQNLRRPPKIFLGEFFFPKTSNLLRKHCTRPAQETLSGLVEGLSAIRNTCRLIDEQAAPQAKNGRCSDAMARLLFRTTG